MEIGSHLEWLILAVILALMFAVSAGIKHKPAPKKTGDSVIAWGALMLIAIVWAMIHFWF